MSDANPDAPSPSSSAAPSPGEGAGSSTDRKRRRRRRGRKGDGEGAPGAAGESGAEAKGESSGDGRPPRRRTRRRGRGRSDQAAGEGAASGAGERGDERRPQARGGGEGENEDEDEGGRRRRRRRRRGGPEGEGEGDGQRSSARGGGERGDERTSRRKRRRRRGDERDEGERGARSRDRGARRSDDAAALDSPEGEASGAVQARGEIDPQGLGESAGLGTSIIGRRVGTDVPDDDADAALEPDFFPTEVEAARPQPDPDDPDPASFDFEDADDDETASLSVRVRNTVGVKFTSSGRIMFYDSGKKYYAEGEEVVVEGNRPPRLGTVAVATARREISRGAPEPGVRRPTQDDRAHFERQRAHADELLAQARAIARETKLPIKVYRLELSHTGKKAQVYFSTEERVEHRDLLKRLNRALGVRVEMRQTGVRDEAKAVGGIGACGLELCCSTWLPEFVPVSIKMAKDQGLVLNPTKVSGQCGRLKCCLVYEQETYAAMRKGLPKLGKRVVTEAGEGRVVEVDVLHQRVRVSLGPGESQVFPGHAVKPMFPAQRQGKKPPPQR